MRPVPISREDHARLSALKADWGNSDLPPLKCGGCRACCIGDTVKLQPGENPALFKTRLVNGRHELRKGKDGNCVYLGKAGCKIQRDKPIACRLYDCRVDFRNDVKRGMVSRLDLPPLRRGRELLHAVSVEEAP